MTFGLLFVVSVLATRFQQDRAYADAGKVAEKGIRVAAEDYSAGRVPIVLVQPAKAPFDGITSINFDWDASAALELRTGDPSVSVRLSRSAGRPMSRVRITPDHGSRVWK